MLSTPTYKHATSADFDRVYEPAEDSFLLIDALEKEAPFISKLKPVICMEFGSGSGVVISSLAKLTKTFCIATDINKHACEFSKRTADENNVVLDVCIDDLSVSLLKRLEASVDILLFNPPYVVTPHEEVGGDGISASWAGGVHGREVIDRFLPLAAKLLSKSGALYLLLLKENKQEEVVSIMKELGFEGRTVIERRAGPEHLCVCKFVRIT